MIKRVARVSLRRQHGRERHFAIDGLLNDVGVVVKWISNRFRVVQTGYVRTYAVSFLLGVVLVIVILILPALQR